MVYKAENSDWCRQAQLIISISLWQMDFNQTTDSCSQGRSESRLPEGKVVFLNMSYTLEMKVSQTCLWHRCCGVGVTYVMMQTMFSEESDVFAIKVKQFLMLELSFEPTYYAILLSVNR